MRLVLSALGGGEVLGEEVFLFAIVPSFFLPRHSRSPRFLASSPCVSTVWFATVYIPWDIRNEEAMATAIAAWGNSEAVRLPREVMRSAGLRRGDRVDLVVNESGRIELVPEKRAHRRVAPAKNVSFETLFAGWEGQESAFACAPSGWPADDLVGAEWDAWSS